MRAERDPGSRSHAHRSQRAHVLAQVDGVLARFGRKRQPDGQVLRASGALIAAIAASVAATPEADIGRLEQVLADPSGRSSDWTVDADALAAAARSKANGLATSLGSGFASCAQPISGSALVTSRVLDVFSPPREDLKG